MKITFIDWPEDEKGLIKGLNRQGVKAFLVNSSQLSYELLRRLDENSDVIYVSRVGPDPWRTLNILRLVKTIGKPTILGILEPTFTLHGVHPSNFIYQIKSLTLITYIKLSKIVKNIHVLNSFDYKLLNIVIGQNIYYAPYGIEISSLPTIRKNDEFTAVFVHAQYRKGGDIVSTLIPSLIRRLNDIRFIVILGSSVPSLRGVFKSLANRYKDHIFIYDFLPKDEFYNLLSQAHVLLFPSKWEVFGRVVLDALACGTPVVAFDIPGAPQDIILRYTNLEIGRIAKAFDLKSFTRNILHYYFLWKYNPDYYLSISKKAQEVAMLYDYNRVSVMYLKMFKSVIGYD